MYSSRFVAIWPPSPATGERSIPYYSAASDRDARSELNHALRQQLEVLRGCRTVAFHPAEELAPPGQEPRPSSEIQFAFTPAARSSPPSVARSSRIWASNCSGVIGMGSAPSLAWRSRTSGD